MTKKITTTIKINEELKENIWSYLIRKSMSSTL